MKKFAIIIILFIGFSCNQDDEHECYAVDDTGEIIYDREGEAVKIICNN